MNFYDIDQHKLLLKLAIPMILSNITVPLLGLVDTAVIGHLDHAYFLGASTVGAMIITFITWLCGFLRMSTTGLSAQAFGAEDRQQGVIVLLRGLFVAGLIGFSFILLQSVYIDFGLYLAGGSNEIQHYAKQYCDIRIWGLPASLANLVILGWLLGNHKAKAVMWILIITNLLNVVLDVVFVFGFSWQVKGVALATVIAEYSGLFLGLVYICTLFKVPLNRVYQRVKSFSVLITDRASLGNYFNLSRDILLRTLCLELCFVFITFQGARLGDTVIATNAILMNFVLLISFGLDGIANATEAMVGKAAGNKNTKERNHVVNLALFWTALFALVYSLAFLFFGDALIRLLTSIEAVIVNTEQFIVWIILLPLVGCWCYLYDGIYVGLMQARAMRNSMIIATFACFFPMWWLFQGFGNHGLWAAFTAFLLVRGLTLAWHYHYRLNRG